MTKLNKLKQLCQTIAVGLLAALLCWQISSPAMAQTTLKSADTAPYFQSDRLEDVLNCIPEQLTLENDDIQDRVARAFGEMTNDYLERTFDLTDDPELSNAEIEFERCLKAKGLVPERQANS